MLCPIIAALPFDADGELRLCERHGIAYQADRSHIVDYGEAYFGKCNGYADGQISRAVNAGRFGLVLRHFGAGRMLDVGIGSGEFIRCRPDTFGFDINPAAIAWLNERRLLAPMGDGFGAFSFWDVLEHVPDPAVYLDRVPLHAFVFASLPVFDDLSLIRGSKHYRPGEHLQYFTPAGFIWWMDAHGFMLLEASDFETQAGRESIGSFAFKRRLCPKKH